MTYIPENRRMCQLEADYGEVHAVFEWQEDATLKSRWPDKRHCEAKGWAFHSPAEHKLMVAWYHWRAIAGVFPVEYAVAESWKDPGPEIETQVKYSKPVAVFRVQLIKRMSQYLGWLSAEDFRKIEPVNVAGKWTTFQRRRRVILQHHLTMGLPKLDKVLFE